MSDPRTPTGADELRAFLTARTELVADGLVACDLLWRVYQAWRATATRETAALQRADFDRLMFARGLHLAFIVGEAGPATDKWQGLALKPYEAPGLREADHLVAAACSHGQIRIYLFDEAHACFATAALDPASATVLTRHLAELLTQHARASSAGSA